MSTNSAGTDVLTIQALRHRVTDLESELDDTRVQLQVTTDQRDRRQLTADALRHALADRTQPMPDIEIDDAAPLLKALRAERKLHEESDRERKSLQARLDRLQRENAALRSQVDMWRIKTARKAKALSEANQTTSRLALVLERTR